ITGQVAKYPTFDAILDRLTLSEGSHGFVGSDGKSISQNTGLAAVFTKSPSVFAAERSEKKNLRLPDQVMEAQINKLFTDNVHGYNPGGMIFEAMAGDGEHIIHLKPRAKRHKYSLDELEEMLNKAAAESL